MAKFKIKFGGFAYVEAENAEQAEEKFDDEDFVYSEYGIAAIEEVGEFVVR